MKLESVEKMIDIISDLMKENRRLNMDIALLEREYGDLNERFLKLEHEYSCLADFTAAVDPNAAVMFNLTEPVDESDSSDPIPVEDMATTTPEIAKESPANDQNGIFPSPASAVHSMVTGTTDQKCFALTAVLGELDQGVSVSKKVLIDQNLFEYRIDERGHNRYLPTDWFREYSVSHGILAEFTGHITKDDKDIKFSWYKVTPFGKQIIKDTAEGTTVWKTFLNGPSEWGGYIPIKKQATNNK